MLFKEEEIKSKAVQLISLIIKDLKLKLRYKSQFFAELLVPLVALFFPYIIFSALFNLNGNPFGNYFTINNYPLFLLLAYIIECLIFLLWYYKEVFSNEKIWLTLKGLMIAPISKFQLYLSYLISGLISKSFPIVIIIILCYIFYPIPLLNLIIVIFIIVCISLTFASMGFIIGLFEIINENISSSLTSLISFISLVSCLYYPISIFPEWVHIFILLNPLYYFFDLLRLSWWMGIDYNDAIQYITINHIIFVVGTTLLLPIIACILFIKLFKKYGISGY
ncbi:MAG: ABC transporter permease [Promethearchaeota archaeon]